jgi:hypothetical protein
MDKENDYRKECNRLSDQTTNHPAKVERKREDPKKKTSVKKRVSQEYPKESPTRSVQYYDMQHGSSLTGGGGGGGSGGGARQSMRYGVCRVR